MLNLSDLHWCPVSTLPLVGLRCPNLKKVSFRNLKQLNNAGIVALADGCPRLSEIDLSGCTGISSTSLIKSVPKWRQMETIKLHRCNQLFFLRIQAMDQKAQTSLEKFIEGSDDGTLC